MSAVPRLTVLHLAANRWWTGSAEPVIRVVSGLRRREHRALLALIPGDLFEAKARHAGIEPLRGLHLDTRAEPLTFARDVRQLRAIVRTESVDIIHAHHSHDHWLSVLARPRGRDGERVPVVRTFHNRRAVKRGVLAAWLYARTSAAFAVSRQIQERCREAALPADRVFWTPGVVDLTRFSPKVDGTPIRAELRLSTAPVVVTVSRLAPGRGHELLLAGFKRLLSEVPEARLLLVGKGESRTALARIVMDLDLTQHVLFTGYRDRDLPTVLAAADCFVLMAAGSEESCRAALEAMAAGRPVVARPVGALPETVVHGETGLLLADDRPATVAAALVTMLRDSARARAMGAAGRRRAETEFDPERMVTIVEQGYRSVLQAGVGRSALASAGA